MESERCGRAGIGWLRMSSGPVPRTVPAPVTRLRGVISDRPELIPGLLGVAAFVGWSAAEGGSLETSTYPGALFLLGLLAVVAFTYRDRLLAMRGPRAVAVGLLGAFAIWSTVSIGWADVEGDAWRGANLALLYFTVFALFAIPRWRSASGAIVLGAYSLGVAVVGAIDFLGAQSSAGPELHFIGGRFVGPTGYQNASAALFAAALWPALLLATRREVHWAARALMLATAGLLFQLSLLPQSRAWLIVFPIVVALFLVVVPGRVRAIVTMVPLAAVLALSAGPVLDVFTTVTEDGDLPAALERARTAALFTVIALLVIGAALALVDRRVVLSPRAARVGSGVVAAVTVAALIAGSVIVLGVIGNPIDWAGDRWEDFKSGQPEEGFEESRFGGALGSNRYDFWRVAANSFADDPLIGVGADNFAVDYLQERRSDEEPRHPHSLPLRIASQTGAIGVVLFAGFLAAAIYGIARVRRRGSPLAQALAAACLAAFAYWFLHAGGDWLWSFPALTGPALAWLAMGGRLGSTGDDGGDGGSPRSPVRPRAVAVPLLGLLLAVALVVSYALPWIAARDVDRAARGWSSDPSGAFEALDRARSLNFLSAEPDLVAGTIASRLGRREAMRAAFRRALDRDPRNWYALLELGALEALEGRRSVAIARLESARRVNPRDPLIASVLLGARDHDPVSLKRIEQELLARVCTRVGHTEATRFCMPR